MFACQNTVYQYCDINLGATLGEGGGRMWPPGRQLPTPAVNEQCAWTKHYLSGGIT